VRDVTLLSHVRVVGAEVPAAVEQVAAHHLGQERIDRPVAEAIQVLAVGYSEGQSVARGEQG